MKLIIGIAIVVTAMSCQKEAKDNLDEKGQLVLQFSHYAKDEVLNFTDDYVNAHGESYTVDGFRYYVHDIKLVNDKNETVVASADYYLVNEELSDSKTIAVDVPAGKYKSITWLLGVDSARNVSGAQTGALDPGLGMFWTWTSGYIMAKLEGHSPASTMGGQAFTYHVGGFKVPYVTARTISLPFSQDVALEANTSITVAVKADIDTWFSRVHPISIATTPACHSPGQLANDLADNYAGMFSIKEVF
jgi:hypothetical protein